MRETDAAPAGRRVQTVVPPGRGQRVPALLRRLRRDPFALVSIVFLLAVTVAAVAAPLVAPYPPDVPDFGHAWEQPSARHVLGTDGLSRDLLSRLIYGGRVSLIVATVVVLAQVAVGVSLGLVAGYGGGWLDGLLMRLTDVVLAFPGLLFVVFLAGTLGPGLRSGLLGLSLLAWPSVARLVRAETLRLSRREFVLGARALGAGDARILLRHILPNALRPVIAILPFTAAFAILGEAGLSFLGIGVQPPTPSWGGLVRDFASRIQTHFLLLLFPTAALAFTTLALNYLAEFIQDRLDPLSRLRGL